VGNPSDGYYGKTIAFTMRNFWSQAVLYESPEIELRPSAQDRTTFDNLGEMVESVKSTGYYGGIRLIKAAVKTFAEYCEDEGIELPDRNFTVRYETNIPRQVGLGGSSAIITAVIRALMHFYEVDVPEHLLPNVVLSAETDELGLTAGLQDRVVQAYEGLVYMDFDRELLDGRGYGRYERLDGCRLAPMYLAYRPASSQESGRAHLKVRERYELGDEDVINTMNEIAALADDAREALVDGQTKELARIMDENFDLRARIFDISDENMEMVKRARDAGASCKFCGSGGAVVGTYQGEEMLERLRKAARQVGYHLILPALRLPDGETAS
jgi:glucuronokinase